MCLLLFLGLHMVFVTLPDRVRNSFYHHSLRIMGFAFFVVPISCLIYTRENRFDLDPLIAPAINLTAYFATFILMAIAFLTLLGKRFNRVAIAIATALIFIYPLPLWISILYSNEEIIESVITASYSLFVMIVILVDTVILYIYNRIINGMDNYYSDDIRISVNWVSKSIKLLIGLSIACAISPLLFTCNQWLRLAIMVFGVLCYLHIHYGYRNMMINITEQFIKINISEFIKADQSDDYNGIMSTDVVHNIQKHIDIWVSEKLYTQNGITINDVAKAIKTNRTYLSKYINTTYNCSFKSWITQLRIEEAKKMLSNNSSSPINSISEEIGFASVESFTHIFTRVEGISPSKWRDENRTLNNNNLTQQ